MSDGALGVVLTTEEHTCRLMLQLPGTQEPLEFATFARVVVDLPDVRDAIERLAEQVGRAVIAHFLKGKVTAVVERRGDEAREAMTAMTAAKH